MRHMIAQVRLIDASKYASEQSDSDDHIDSKTSYTITPRKIDQI